jgi:peptide/nickel transport system substrate-binding protein
MAWGTTSVLSGLLKYNPDLELEPHMAALPEQPDELTYIFTLEDGISWQDLPPADGRAFTAEDAAFGLQRFSEPNPEFIYGSSLAPVETYEAVDERTLRLVTGQPHAPLLAAISDDWCMMVNREQREAVGDAGIKEYNNLLGTGPWMRGEMTPAVSSFLERNPNYFRAGQPYMDRIEFTIVSDPTAREAAFRSKQFDTPSIWGGVNKQTADGFKEQMGDDMEIISKPLTAPITFTFNTQKEPFNDQRVRRAFHLAHDRQAVQAAYGEGNSLIMAAIAQPLSQYAIPESELLEMPGYRQPKDEDIAEALQLMEAAGFGDGLEVTCRTYPSFPLAISLQASLQAIGVDLSLNEGQFIEILADRAQGNFDVLAASTVGAPDPDHYLYVHNHTDGTSNYGKYSNPDVDALCEQQRQTLDLGERQEIVNELQLLLLEESPQLWTFASVLYAVHLSTVKDRTVIPGFNQWMTADMYLEEA